MIHKSNDTMSKILEHGKPMGAVSVFKIEELFESTVSRHLLKIYLVDK